MKRMIWALVALIITMNGSIVAALGETLTRDSRPVEISYNYTFANQPTEDELQRFDDLLKTWQAAHPEVTVTIKDRTSGELTYLARMRHMPDIYCVDGLSGRIYTKHGLALDLTDAVVESEYSERYDYSSLMPYFYLQHAFAFPVLSNSVSVIIYDGKTWEKAGFDAFPNDWAAMERARDQMQSQGYQGIIAIGNAGGYPAIDLVLSAIMAWSDGNDWLQKMIDGSRDVMLTDEIFVNALETMGRMFADGIFCRDYASWNSEMAIQSFVDGKCPSLLTGGSDIYKTLSMIQSSDPERYAALKFAPLPVPPGYSGEASYMSSGINNGLFINPNVASDPEKLAACIDFCRFMTGPEYAEPMAKSYGQTCFTGVEAHDLTQAIDEMDDQTLARFAAYCQSGMKACPRLTLFLHSTVWSTLAGSFDRLVSGIESDYQSPDYLTAEEIANLMQDEYEQNYFAE